MGCGCLLWVPVTLASRDGARASRLPTRSPCCARGSHQLFPPAHDGHSQPDKGHPEGGNIKSRMWERTVGQGANRGEEEDVEKKRKKG